MNSIFYYECYFTELDHPEKNKMYGGFLGAKNYAEAAEKLEEFCGDDLVSIEKLYDLGVPMTFFDVENARAIEHIFHEQCING